MRRRNRMVTSAAAAGVLAVGAAAALAAVPDAPTAQITVPRPVTAAARHHSGVDVASLRARAEAQATQHQIDALRRHIAITKAQLAAATKRQAAAKAAARVAARQAAVAAAHAAEAQRSAVGANLAAGAPVATYPAGPAPQKIISTPPRTHTTTGASGGSGAKSTGSEDDGHGDDHGHGDNDGGDD